MFFGTFLSTGITNLARPSLMDITKTDWDAYEAQLADNMTNLADSFSNLNSLDKVYKAAGILYQSWKLLTHSATDLTCFMQSQPTPVGYAGCEGSQGRYKN